MVEEIGMVGKREKSGPSDAVDGCAGCGTRTTYQSATSGTSDLSLPVAGHEDPGTRRSMVFRYHLYPDAAGIPVPDSNYGLVQPVCPGVGIVELAGDSFLSHRAGKIADQGAARDFQYRPGGTVYQPGFFGVFEGSRDPNKYGRTRSVLGQYLHRAVVAQFEVRGGLHSRLRRWKYRPSETEEIFSVLQHGPAASGVGISDTGRGLSRWCSVKIQGYKTMGGTEISRYTRFWKVVFSGVVHRRAGSVISARKQTESGTRLHRSGKIIHTIRRCNVQRSLAYFSAVAVQ